MKFRIRDEAAEQRFWKEYIKDKIEDYIKYGISSQIPVYNCVCYYDVDIHDFYLGKMY